MGWRATTAAIMEVVQAMVDEGGESASTTLGVDLDELLVAIVGAAHAVVVEVQMALANQFGELQQGRPAVGAVHQQQAESGPDEVLLIWSDHIDRFPEVEQAASEMQQAAAQGEEMQQAAPEMHTLLVNQALL